MPEAESALRRPRARAGARAVRVPVVGTLALALVATALAIVLSYAGSAGRIADGVSISGVPVGGLTRSQALSLLERRAAHLRAVPVVFAAGSHRFRLRPEQLAVQAGWRRAVDQALAKGSGFSLVRGVRRLALRVRHVDVEPRVRFYRAAVDYETGLMAQAIDRPHVEARLVRRGLSIDLVDGQTGLLLDRRAAARSIVDALAGFSRAPVALPVAADPPRVTARDLVRTAALARRVVSAPVQLRPARVALSRRQLARMLQLPAAGSGTLEIGGAAADAWFAALARRLAVAPRNARFAAEGKRVTIVPAQAGTAVDVPRTAASVLAAAERTRDRVAQIAEAPLQPRRTTAEARAMGITGVVGSYETVFGGIPNRIHNVELVAHLVDGKLIAPGATFSFNQTTGARTAAKGFLAAPVIIDGELQTALGGGVCQVSTTVFNAAYVAGLPITDRTNHALYISHYPLGRDATVDYPDIDLRFVNDTPHWLLLRTFVTSSSLVVTLYGAPQNRRVVTDSSPLVVTGPPPVQKTVDPSLQAGQRVVVDPGVPSQSTWVRRRVYSAGGTLLQDSTWYSNYDAQPELVDVGPRPKQQAPPLTTSPARSHRALP